MTTTPRPARRTEETRPGLIHWIAAAAFLSLMAAPAVLAAVPTPVAVVIALSVALASLAGYVALGRRG